MYLIFFSITLLQFLIFFSLLIVHKSESDSVITVINLPSILACINYAVTKFFIFAVLQVLQVAVL